MNSSAAPFAFENSFLRMPDHFYARVAPTPVEAPKLLALNRPLCEEMGVSYQSLAPVADALLSGNQIPEGAASIALAYAGHQFGNFVPQLGDGRAILLGEILTPHGERKDIQLKGAGPTPFSRRGDGRAALGPVLREFLVSEATGEPVYREETLPGAVLTRVAASHIRVGTFEYFAAREDYRAVETLARHVITRHYPELEALENPFLPLLDAVAQKQAALIARWMLVGFVHGVMNTDNMSVSGETIDYGPCAFLDRYDPATVFSSIDRGGRYAFANQPVIAQWNLARLAETLVPLIHPDTETALEMATAAIHKIPEYFESHWLAGMRLKLGLYSEEPSDKELAQRLLSAMHDGGADFTLTFRRLSQLCDATLGTDNGAGPAALFSKPALFLDWA
ncbi:MAG: YdiU family protein, partial [Proteobacteria bacterium]|nr:YdiU family protein [Pseudomonadota bacterium]